MEVSGQLHAPAALLPGKERALGTHWIGGWVCPRTVLDVVKRKIPSPRRESTNRDVKFIIDIDHKYFDVRIILGWILNRVRSCGLASTGSRCSTVKMVIKIVFLERR
jgi:hypothetical protein